MTDPESDQQVVGRDLQRRSSTQDSRPHFRATDLRRPCGRSIHEQELVQVEQHPAGLFEAVSLGVGEQR